MSETDQFKQEFETSDDDGKQPTGKYYKDVSEEYSKEIQGTEPVSTKADTMKNKLTQKLFEQEQERLTYQSVKEPKDQMRETQLQNITSTYIYIYYSSQICMLYLILSAI